MWRRRRPGRAIRRAIRRRLRRRAVPPALVSRLRRAHRLKSDGEYALAAAEYLELAGRAEQRGVPQAARLYLAAGMATVEAGESESGTDHLRHGLQLLQRHASPGRCGRAAARIVGQLEARGHQQVVEHMRDYLQEHGIELAELADRAEPSTALPAKCPQCGATVRPAELAWFDKRSAECDYCGSVLKASSE